MFCSENFGISSLLQVMKNLALFYGELLLYMLSVYLRLETPSQRSMEFGSVGLAWSLFPWPIIVLRGLIIALFCARLSSGDATEARALQHTCNVLG